MPVWFLVLNCSYSGNSHELVPINYHIIIIEEECQLSIAKCICDWPPKLLTFNLSEGRDGNVQKTTLLTPDLGKNYPHRAKDWTIFLDFRGRIPNSGAKNRDQRTPFKANPYRNISKTATKKIFEKSIQPLF